MNFHRRTRGSALTVVVVMIVIIMALAVAFTGNSVNISDVNLKREWRYQARVAAMSGLQRAIIELDASVAGACSHSPAGVTKTCIGNIDGNILDTRVTALADSPTVQKTWSGTPITGGSTLLTSDNFSMHSLTPQSANAETDGWNDFRDQGSSKPWRALDPNAPDGTYTVRVKPEGGNDLLGRKQAYRIRVYAVWKREVVGYEALVRKAIIKVFKFAAFGDVELVGNGSINTDSWKSGLPEDPGTTFTAVTDYATADAADPGLFPVNTNGDIGSNGIVDLNGGSNSINGAQVPNAAQTIPDVVFPAEPTSMSFEYGTGGGPSYSTATTIPQNATTNGDHHIGSDAARLGSTGSNTKIVLGSVDYGNNLMTIYPAADSVVNIYVRGPKFEMGNGAGAGLKIDQPTLTVGQKPGVVKFYLEEGVTSISMNGQGVVNNDPGSAPYCCQFISKSTATIHFGGSSAQNMVVMAPNATVDLAGGGDFYGAIVSSTITLSGNSTFHYDESLANSELEEGFPIYRIFALVEVPQRN